MIEKAQNCFYYYTYYYYYYQLLPTTEQIKESYEKYKNYKKHVLLKCLVSSFYISKTGIGVRERDN